jgi:hypothetical protein
LINSGVGKSGRQAGKKGVSLAHQKKRALKGYSPMETNETLKRALMSQAEASVDRLLRKVQEGKEGDFQEREQRIREESTEFGRSCLEAILEDQAKRQGSAARRWGRCGHRQRVVSTRPRHMVTLLGPIVVQRAYSQCLIRKEDEAKKGEGSACSHGEAPFDQQWGWGTQRSSPGVQQVVSDLSAQRTLQGGAEAVSRLLPLAMSARQVLNLSQPVGEAFLKREDSKVQDLLTQGATKRTSEAERRNARGEPIKRLSIETDGVSARLRRGSVAMETEEQERQGEVSRDVKEGAVCVGQPGRERSELVPGVFVDTPGPIRDVARRTTTDDFAPLLSALAHREGP